MPALPSKTLETFPNPEPARDYIIEIEAPEFTCLCPKTGQPDFATLQIEYVPDRLCVELKSLKLYIWSYRDEGHFHEKVTNTVLSDLVAAIQPRYLQVRALFNVRGGIYTTVTAEHRRPGWSPPPPPPDGLPRVSQSARDAQVPAAGAEPDRPPDPAPDAAGAASPALPGRTPAARAPRPERFRMLRRDRAAPSPDAKASSRPAAPASPPRDVYLGIDLGTGACRVVAIDAKGKMLALAETPLPRPVRDKEQRIQDPNDWWKAAVTSLKHVLGQIDARRVHRVAVAATSGTLLLCDAEGEPVTPGILYNDRRALAEAERIAETAQAETAVHGTGSSLAKLLWLRGKKEQRRAAHALHPADWIGNRLRGVYGHSDYHNCLKLGYDPAASAWPAWFQALDVPEALLPQVHAPGERLGPVSPKTATAFGLPAEVEVAAGTTDGVAAFIAAGANQPGHGVTSLGNTLVIKLLCEQPIVSAPHGVYSHRLGRLWLAGGASNSGGNVLSQYFTPEQLREMTPLLDPENPTDLDYYPLIDIGERFPVNDPRLEPRLEPLPGDSVTFFQGMLEGIARIEAQGYAVLAELGAPAVTAVWTTGGGSLNPAWTRIRGCALGVPLKAARSQQAAFGAALLAAGIVEKTFA